MKKMVSLYPAFISSVVIAFLLTIITSGKVSAQTYSDSAFTGGLKYNLLEVSVGTWTGWTPDADQDVVEKVLPMYPRTIVAFWHGADTMKITGDPYIVGVGIPGYPSGTIDRAQFGGTIHQMRPWETNVGVRNVLTPKFDVKTVCSYNAATSTLTVKVTGTALTTLSGSWNINAYVLQDSVSTSLSTAHRQTNYLNTAGSTSCTGSPSWYIGMGSPISSGSAYSHMYVARAILCPGGSIWGEAAFSGPTTGTAVTKTYTYVVPAAYLHHLKVVGLVEKYGATTDDRAIENAIQVNVPLPSQLFAWSSSSVSRSVCQGATASIDSFLDVIDLAAGHTVSWSLASAPLHGTAVATYSTTSTGSTLYTSGLSYTPTASYTGTDSFKVSVTNGAGGYDTITIRYTINPSPSAFTGTMSICTGTSSTLGSTPTGGTWASSSTTIATIGSSSGIANGMAVGTSTITYTAPGTGCKTTGVVTVITTPVAGTITGVSSVCAASSITLSNSVSGGTWSSSATGVGTVGVTTGIVTGIASGVTTISYSVTNSCGTAVALSNVSVNPLPSVPTGTMSICTGATSTLSSTPAGGTWSSGTPTVATIGTSSGIANGIAAGTTTITYTAATGCKSNAVMTVNISPLAGTITGTSSVCVASSITLTSSATGGIWSSSAASVATVGASNGIVTGIANGVTTISYSVTNSCGTAVATFNVSVNPLPSVPTGTMTICTGAITTLSSTPSGGTWTSGTPTVATVGTSSGIVNGLTTGTTVITYTAATGCKSNAVMTVNASPVAGTISGTSSVCVASSITLTSSATGGTWSSSSSTVATAGASSGIVTGVASGVTTISYSVTNTCGTAVATFTVSVNPLPSVPTGTMSICTGATATLSSTPAGGTWTSSTPTIATIGSSSGIANGLAAGTTTITYTAATGCKASAVMTVNASPVAGTISGVSSVCAGSSITLTGSVTGGSWSSSATGAATISSSTGIVTGVASGVTMISYSVTNTCGTAVATFSVSINPLPSVPTGTMTICTGGTSTLSSTPAGGTWTSGAATIATIGSGSGVVSGIASGTADITYTSPAGCTIAAVVTVSTMPVSGTITGVSTVCEESSITLANTVTGGTWTSSSSSVATVGTSNGIVTGVAAGITQISYTVTNLCGTATATFTVSVNPLPVPGTISGITTVCEGQTTTLSATATGGAWSSTSANATVNATGVVTGVTAGTTTISYTLTNSCGPRAATTSVNVISGGNCTNTVQEAPYVQPVSIYPNPATDELHIDLKAMSSAEVSILNSVGAVVIRQSVTSGANTLSVRQLPRGIFIAEILCPNGERLVHKMVVE